MVVSSARRCAELSARQRGSFSKSFALRAAVDDYGKLVVQVSTRELAESLGLNKDTVTRALARLRECKHIGVVARGGSAGAARFAIHAPGLTRVLTNEIDLAP